MPIVSLDLQVVSYTKAAFLALLAYDTLLQLNQESIAGVAFWAVTRWTSSSHFTDTSGLPACFLENSSSGIGVGLVCYLSLLVGETIIILLTLWKLFRKFSHKSALLNSLYRDGIWFYLAILPFTIGGVAVLFFAPPRLGDLANPYAFSFTQSANHQLALHSLAL
ncbi:hypothetical protein FB451DRAFT_1401057 [Mycena latifolia]|nr:hypothetical protein FB451DRAFT_1401057 [Mycena latifolia]